MRAALRIFRNDVRRLWPGIAAVLFLTALASRAMPVRPHGRALESFHPPLDVVLTLVLTVVQWLLVAGLIHGEALAGSRQYWVTRPFSRSSLFVAKLLFLVVFLVGFPVLAGLISNTGALPAAHAVDIVAIAFFLFVDSVLPAVALAVITENLMQFVWASLTAVGAYVLIYYFVVSEFFENRDWGSVEWVRSLECSILLLVFAAVILMLQYGARRTVPARWLAACGLVILAMARTWGLWHSAFEFQAFLKPRVPVSVVQILPASADPPGSDAGPNASWPSEQQPDSLNLPVTITGLPAGMVAVSRRAKVTVDTPAGRHWASDWTALGGILPYTHSPVYVFGSTPIRSNGPYRLHVNVRRGLVRPEDLPVHIHARIAMTLFGPATRTLLPSSGRLQTVGDGFCARLSSGRTSPVAVCAWPFRPPAGIGLRPNTADEIEPGGSLCPTEFCGDSGAPYASTWWRTGSLRSSLPLAEGADLFVETRDAAGHFEREVDIVWP